MNRARERHNAKARQSTAGSHKKKRTKVSHEAAAEQDPNALIVVPKSEAEKELERRERLKQELIAQSDSKVNSKKKKRLEKYIEKKLKQDERVVLFEKLSKTQTELPNALGLASSSTLGTGRAVTHRQRLEQAEHHEVKRSLDGRSGPGKRKRAARVHDLSADTSSDSDAFFDNETAKDPRQENLDDAAGSSARHPVVIIDGTTPVTVDTSSDTKTVVVGGALKRKADGTVEQPRVVKQRKKSLAFASWKDRDTPSKAQEAESESSFDSSDSAYDTHEDAGSESSGDDDDEENGAESGQSSDDEQAPPRKKLGFKDWAMKQLSVAKSYVAPVGSDAITALAEPAAEVTAPPPAKKREVDPAHPREMRGPLGQTLVLPETAFTKHLQQEAQDPKGGHLRRKVVEVSRPADVEAARLLLPIVSEEQPIMEAILLNPVVIVCGETGSGKTTQVPQFLYEAGFGSPDSENPGMIGVTQPRRVAAMSMAARVAHELSLTSSKVSYQIRYDATVSSTTSIKFMTDGVLLRELATDFLLSKYSVIIIDEAHERSVNTDVLIGVLSRVIKLREEMWVQNKDGTKPLRLIIMSATLRVSDFAENTTLFPKPPPIIHIAARQHPVAVHFSRRTVPDYVSEAIRKACKIHTRLPPGGILIFLTGQNEITGACRKLEARYGAKALEERKRRRTAPNTRIASVVAEAVPVQSTTADGRIADMEAEDVDLGAEDEVAADLAEDAPEQDDEALDTDEDDIDKELAEDLAEADVPMHIVPLYALLPSEKQMKVFEPPPAGSRLVVVSTNVAETSLTIPGIRYVIDCGRAKERRYNMTNGVQSFPVSWISKASAAQRAGRAGRTGPGHCYRLYSSALYEEYFEQFTEPEILRMPVEGVALQMKAMHIDAVINFPFPTPPDRMALRKAEIVLTQLGALTPATPSTTTGGQITDVGRAMSLFPLSPRYARMLVGGRQHGTLPYIIAVVSALSVGDPFLREEALLNADSEDADDEDEEDEETRHLTSAAVKAKEVRRLRRKAFFKSQETHAALGNHSSDVFRILSVVGAYEYAGGGHDFCADQFVRPKAMEEIHKLRAQISNIVQVNFPDLNAGFVANLLPPNALQLKVLRQLLTAALIDQVAVRKDKVTKDAASGQQFSTSRGVPYRALGIDEDVFIHPSSVLASQPPPEFVVFLDVVRTTKVWIKGLTVINGAWIANLGKSMCTFSKPIKTKEGKSVVIPHFGPSGWELPPVAAP